MRMTKKNLRKTLFCFPLHSIVFQEKMVIKTLFGQRVGTNIIYCQKKLNPLLKVFDRQKKRTVRKLKKFWAWNFLEFSLSFRAQNSFGNREKVLAINFR